MDLVHARRANWVPISLIVDVLYATPAQVVVSLEGKLVLCQFQNAQVCTPRSSNRMCFKHYFVLMNFIAIITSWCLWMNRELILATQRTVLCLAIQHLFLAKHKDAFFVFLVARYFFTTVAWVLVQNFVYKIFIPESKGKMRIFLFYLQSRQWFLLCITLPEQRNVHPWRINLQLQVQGRFHW